MFMRSDQANLPTEQKNQSIDSKSMKRNALFSAIALSLAVSAPVSSETIILEEIVVTAQKRAQSLQDVPISVSVTTGDTMEKMSITTLEGLSASIPNVTIAENATQDSVTIRAIGSGANHGFEQSVGTFIDGVYFGRGRSSRSPFLDIERLEILKGPQGVLFGKNTIAGALNITTRKPTQEFEGSIEAEYFDGDDSYSVTGIVSGPLSDTVAGRLVVKKAESNGYIENISTGDDETAKNEQVARASLSWDATDDFSILVTGGVSSYDQDGRHMQLVQGGNNSGFYQGFDSNYEEKLDYKRSVTNPTLGDDFDNTDAYNFTVTARYDMENATLVSISSVVGYDYKNNINANFVGGFETAAKRYDEEHEQLSQEFRLESSGDGNFDYVLGVFYQTETLDHFQNFNFNPLGAGETNFDIKQDTDSLAIFGQGTWHINDSLRTTLGLRYTKDEKDIDFDQSGVNFVGFPVRSSTSDRTDSDLTPSLNVQWNVAEDVMLYATYSEGFKSGGFDFESGGAFEEETVVAWELGAKSSLLDGAAELNIAIFRSEFDNLQVSAFNGISFNTTNAATAITEGVEIDGRWKITDSLLLTGAIAFLNGEYDEFSDAVCTAPQQIAHNAATGLGFNSCVQDLSGQDLQFAADWAGSLGLEYMQMLNDNLELTVNLALEFTDAYYTALDLDPVSEQDAFSKLNLRVQIADDENWSVALVGKNLTNEKTTTWINDVPLFRTSYFGAIDPPRSIGIQGKYAF